MSKDDFKLLDRLIASATGAEMSAHVGYFDDGDRHPRSGESAAYIAAINNNGGDVMEGGKVVFIPSRPFVRDGVNEAEIPTEDQMVRAYERFQAGKIPLSDALEEAGEVVIYFINNTLDEGAFRYTGNAPYTINQKGFDRPLYETGWLRTKTDLKIKVGVKDDG